MKKILVILSALFALVACSKEASVSETVEKELVFNISVNHPENTKAVKTGWVTGDVVYVFFEGKPATQYVQLIYRNSSWQATLMGGLSENTFISGLSSSGNMYAVFFPYEKPVIESDGGTGVTFKTGGTDLAKAGLGIYTYYMTSTATYTKDTSGDIATISGTLNMVNPEGYVQFYISGSGSGASAKYKENGRYRLSVEGVKPKACVSYDNGVFGTKELNAAQPMWGYVLSGGVAFSGVIDESWKESSNSHLIYLFDTKDAAKSITISDKTLSSHDAVNFYGKNHPINAATNWTAAATAPGTVTVGDTKWGTFNLGATAAGTAAENYGWYFAWGDIIPVRGTTVAPTGYGGASYYNNTIAYEALNGKSVDLIADGDNHWEIYDMVRAFLGYPWRMPKGPTGEDAEGEFARLLGTTTPVVNTNYTWGDNCAMITTAGSITFPAAGDWNITGFEWGGTYANYWYSTYSTETRSRRYSIYCSQDKVYPINGSDRGMATPVRPVQDAE